MYDSRRLSRKREVDMATQDRAGGAATVRRPCADAAHASDASQLAGGGRAPIALVVDDEPLIRRFVSTILRREGWSVLEAADGVSALAMAEAEPLDLLVTDYEMPRFSGVALATELRKRDGDLPVLMVSGHPDAARKMQGLDGRTAFTLKPFAADELVSRICSIVG
jgi:CheY-like chemotaxis protein